jgi:hypothetical protein
VRGSHSWFVHYHRGKATFYHSLCYIWSLSGYERKCREPEIKRKSSTFTPYFSSCLCSFLLPHFKEPSFAHFLSVWRFLSHSFRVDLLATNSPSFPLSENILISPFLFSVNIELWADKFFSFQCLKMLCHTLVALWFLMRTAVIFIVFPYK